MKALILPIDDRPITSIYPQMIGQIAGAQLICPPKNILGSLRQPAQPEALINWIDDQLSNPPIDALLLCLDNLLYGGLVNSRRSSDSLPAVLARSQHIKRWRKLIGPQANIFAQSSIMRISDNYDPSEEKAYWAKFGREIFSWSSYLHRLSRSEGAEQGMLSAIESKLPLAIRQDYLQGRWRNYQVNRSLIDKVRQKDIDLLIFSLDDSGETGLNVFEKDRLMAESNLSGHGQQILAYAGADEVLMTLIARLLIKRNSKQPRAKVIFSPPESERCSSRYEGQTIGQTVKEQCFALQIELADADPDLVILIHGRPGQQADHIKLPEHADTGQVDTTVSVRKTLEALRTIGKPVVLCDVAYANGSDPQLVPELLRKPDLLLKLWGYAGWNTTGNSVGCALATGIARWFALTNNTLLSDFALKQALFVRLTDDWAYQAVIRKTLEQPVSANELSALLKPYWQSIAYALKWQPDTVHLNLPWQRLFEIEVAL